MITIVYNTPTGQRRRRAVNPGHISRVYFKSGVQGGYDHVVAEGSFAIHASGAFPVIFEVYAAPGRGKQVFEELVAGLSGRGADLAAFVWLTNFEPVAEVTNSEASK